jgi:phosphohistidine phosphatase
MRHGEAERSIGRDFDRNLTDWGRQGVDRSCDVLIDKGVDIVNIFTSPLLRAQQTAEIVHRRLSVKETVITAPELIPNGDCDTVADLLLNRERVLLVTHQPLIGDLVEYFCGRRIDMTPASIAVITGDTLNFHGGQLEWLVTE